MKYKNYLFLLLLAFSLSSCSDDEEEQINTAPGPVKQEYTCQAGDPNIIGAWCKDGSRSNATGQGACSQHGGVSSWICAK